MLRNLLTILFLCLECLFLKAETYPEVVFDNSLVKGVYARSYTEYSGKSWVGNINKQLPVSDTLFFTPGNSLSLRYLSNSDGDWNVAIRYSRQKFHYRLSSNDMLNLKIYVKSDYTKASDLPSISVKQFNNHSISLPLESYVKNFKPNSWLNISIPVREFAGLNLDEQISGIILRQLRDSKQVHHVFLDQIEFLPSDFSRAALTSAAVLSKATAYGNHVDLQWQVPLTQSIRYVKIYRSENNKDFKPVGIRPTYMLRCLDYVPALDKKYYYKITWLDFNYQESPFSEVREVETKELGDEELFNLIQLAHVNYFIENYDVNSGMYMPFRMKDKAIVSVQETGGALLSLLVGVERGLMSKSLFISRVKRVVSFLEKAQNKYGFFPSYFDGRKGIPEYLGGRPEYDIASSAAIIESLLVIRQYLKGDEAAEMEIRHGITNIWERMDWKAVTVPNDSTTLRSKLDMIDEFFNQDRISGINIGLNTYLLAIASTKSSIPSESFGSAIFNKYVKNTEVNQNAVTDSLIFKVDSLAEVIPNDDIQITESVDSVIMISALQDTLLYGVDLKLGVPQGNLLRMFRPFFTIDPDIAILGDFDLADVVADYARAIKRRDNEIGLGVRNSEIWGLEQGENSVVGFRINPAISVASAYLKENSTLRSAKALYKEYGEFLFSEYGFRSWVDLLSNDVSDSYSATNQSSIVVLLENSKTGFIWDLYQQIPEIQAVEQRLFRKKKN